MDVLDLSFEATPARGVPFGPGPRCWRGSDIDARSCAFRLSGAMRAEIDAAVTALRERPLPVVLRDSSEFEWPETAGLMGAVRCQLTDGTGVAVVDRLPLDDLSNEEATALFWALGQLVGRAVAQKWDGTMLYDVADHGLEYGYGVRGSYTSVELVFHTDNAFGVAPPEQVGLMCFHPALTGGVSRFCSMRAVHDRLLATAPELLERLHRPMLFDRQAEHRPGAPTVVRAPFFRIVDGRLFARANTSLVRKGHEVAEVALDAALAEALDAFDATTVEAGAAIELPIERGQLQFVNNEDIAHYRSEFRDHPDPARRRHLVRTWHRGRGARVYDG